MISVAFLLIAHFEPRLRHNTMCAICDYIFNGVMRGHYPSIVCNKCVKLSEIPAIVVERLSADQGIIAAEAVMRKLECHRCPNLKSIVMPKKMVKFSCEECPQLSTITGADVLGSINLHGCRELKSLPTFKKLIHFRMSGCPYITFLPYGRVASLVIFRQPFTHISRRYTNRSHTTTEAKVRRWVWRGRVAARARAETLTWLIRPLANIVVVYLAPRWR